MPRKACSSGLHGYQTPLPCRLLTVIFYVAAFGRGCTTDTTPEDYEVKIDYSCRQYMWNSSIPVTQVVLAVLINVPGFICFITILVWYFVQLVRFLQFPKDRVCIQHTQTIFPLILLLYIRLCVYRVGRIATLPLVWPRS